MAFGFNLYLVSVQNALFIQLKSSPNAFANLWRFLSRQQRVVGAQMSSELLYEVEKLFIYYK